MKILPNTQRLGKLTFDSNQVKKSKTNPNVLIAKASDGKDYGVVRKSDGSYDFAGSSRNATFGDRMTTASANPNIANRMLDTAGLLMSEPQRMMTRKLTNNRYNNPEEVVADSKLPDGMLKNTLGFAAGMLADPFNAVGAGAGAKAAKLAMMLPAIPGLNKLFKSSKVMSKIGDAIQPFKSEINWAKWNKEIPNNSELMKEYNAIEKTSKANKSWMKNPDGSAFKGTPEQFVQQNSENFKKAFPNVLRDRTGNVQKTYHGSQDKFESFDPSIMRVGRTRGQGIYTSPIKERAASYANKGEKQLYEFYQNANKKQTIIEDFNALSQKRFDKFLKENPKGSEGFDEKFKAFMDEEDIIFDRDLSDDDFNLNKDYDFYKVSPDEYVVPFTNYPKSAIGNSGMFDMTNPNIYKGIVPGAIAAGAAASTMSNKDKNNKFKYGGKLLPLLNKF